MILKDSYLAENEETGNSHPCRKTQTAQNKGQKLSSKVAAVIVTAVLTTNSYGLVGETPLEAQKHYGNPVKIEEDGSGSSVLTYFKEGTTIVAQALQGRIVLESYAKSPEWGNVITRPEVRAILELYGGIAQNWSETEVEGKIGYFHKSKGIMALWDSKRCVLLVATKKHFEEWMRGRQSAPSQTGTSQ